MGKISDRVNEEQKLKSTPRGNTAIAIVQRLQQLNKIQNATISSENALDKELVLGEEMEDILIKQLETLNCPEFEALLDTCHENISSKKNSAELLESLHFQLDCLVDHSYTDSTSGEFLVLPLHFTSAKSTHNIHLTDEMEMKISEVLKLSGLVADNATISYMPRLLSSEESLTLQHYELYGILNKLRDHKPRDALAMVIQARLKDHLGFPDTGNSDVYTNTEGYLVAYVSQTHEDYDKPLFMWSDVLDDSDSQNSKIEATLEDVASTLQTILNVSLMDIVRPENMAMETLSLLARQKRLKDANEVFQAFAAKADMDYFDYDPVYYEGGCNIYLVDDKNDITSIMRWPFLHNEFPHEAVNALAEYLDDKCIAHMDSKI